MQTGDSYNRGGYLAFLFSMAFSLAFFVYIVWIQPGIDLKEIPEEAKTSTAAASGENKKAIDISKIENPWEPNEEVVAYGKGIYQMNCSACHGTEGDGKGPAGGSLIPPPRNIIEGKWKYGGDSISLFKTITKGVEGTSMAPFGHLSTADRWAMIQFMRSITQNKIADDSAKLSEFAKTAK